MIAWSWECTPVVTAMCGSEGSPYSWRHAAVGLFILHQSTASASHVPVSTVTDGA